MRIFRFLTIGFLMMSCTADPPVEASHYETMSTVDLWGRHGKTQTPLELVFVEAELGLRGEVGFGQDHLGKRTASAVGRAQYARGAGVPIGMNCDDFQNSAAAQKFFLRNGGPWSDPHDLDRDGDGLACEWGTHLMRVSQTRLVPAPPRYQAYAPICHTGPRGGTYTITASGRKNYGGC